MLQAFEPMKRIVGLDGDGSNRSVVLFQTARRADQGAGRAQPRDEMRDASGGLLEDLDRGPFVVSARVGGVRVLVGIEIPLRVPLHDLAHHDDGAVRTLARVAVDDLRAEGGDQRLALGADVAGHHEAHAISLGSADQRVGDSGVAGGRVDDRFFARQRAAALPVLDHRQRRAVLDRAAGIEPFGLRIDLDVRELALEEPHTQEWRVPDQPCDARGACAAHVSEKDRNQRQPAKW